MSGLEYVEECAHGCRTLLADHGIVADIFHADLFDFAAPPDTLWDIVASFGFVEHFRDITPCIHRHLDLLTPGGYLVVVIPNHAGLNGRIMKLVNPDTFTKHNCMTYEMLEDGVMRTSRADILDGGYFGRIGFWNTTPYQRANQWGRLPYLAVRSSLYAIESIGQHFVTNGPFFAPYAALIARKR